MDNASIKFDSIIIGYDEPKKTIKVTRVLKFSDGHTETKNYRGISDVEKLLDNFADQEGISVSALCSDLNKVIINSKELEGRGVLVIDQIDKKYKRYRKVVFNRASGSFDDIHFSRADQAMLGFRDISQSNNIYDIAAELHRLNPDAIIRVGIFGLDSNNNTRIYSSVSGKDLVLPNGFYYNDKNGITNKHLTKNGPYAAIEVRDLSMLPESAEWMFIPVSVDLSNREEVAKVIKEANEAAVKRDIVVPKKDKTTKDDNSKDDGHKDSVVEENQEEPEEVNKDEVVETTEKENKKENKKEKKRVTKLRIIGGALLATILLGVGYSIYENSEYEKQKSMKKGEPDPKPRQEQSGNSMPSIDNNTIPTTDGGVCAVELPDAGSYDYAYLGSLGTEEDMVTQLDAIDRMAMSRWPFNLENIVVADDYDAIRAISNKRLDVLNGICTKEDYMNTISRYIFEKDNYINGNFVEQFDSLHPYGKYIVIRLSQGVLQWCFDDGYAYQDISYSTDYLMDRFDVMGSELYTQLVSAQKVR